MTAYTLKHFDASATRAHMEHVVATFNQSSSGQIKVTDYKVALLVVEAEDSVMDAFCKANPQWGVNKVAYLDHGPIALDYNNLKKNLGL